MNELMKDFKNWTEVTKGLYHYAIATNVAYEIHILYWENGTDILTAKASLFLVGDWESDRRSYMARQCLLCEQPVFECLNRAVNDFCCLVENNRDWKNNNYM